MKKWWIAGILVIAGGVVLANAGRAHVPSTKQLLGAARGADRVLIVPTHMISGEGRPLLPSFEIQGEEQVADFLQQIDIVQPEFANFGVTTSMESFRCGCDGDFHFQVYRGEYLLMSIGYHHGKSIRWRNGPWGTDVYLTTASSRAVPQWLVNNGYSTLKNHYDH
jgi:hypothetical protein